jgi:hypothetical protein
MASLIYYTEEEQVLVATDTLATSDEMKGQHTYCSNSGLYVSCPIVSPYPPYPPISPPGTGRT